MNNSTCFTLLGCNAGFFGYDAIEHFLCGAAVFLAILWLCKKFPEHSILPNERYWKIALTLVAYVALLAVLWEILECAHDYFNLSILHEHLFNYRLHINALDQPSNLDTMGDISFTLIGALVSLGIYVAARFEKLTS